jgi:hypothetical protein
MADSYPAAAQRQALLALIPSLGCSDMTLRRDECGDPGISGKHGHAYAVPGAGFAIFVNCETRTGATSARRASPNCESGSSAWQKRGERHDAR